LLVIITTENCLNENARCPSIVFNIVTVKKKNYTRAPGKSPLYSEVYRVNVPGP
jgi:hypothetical protein